MALANGLLVATVSHARTQPQRHAFSYHVYYLCFALSEKIRLKNPLLSLNRFNVFSFHDRDHGEGKTSPEAWIREVLKQWNIPVANGRIVLLTLPRVLGYAFNPVSFWFCLDNEGTLRAVVSEVTNTFKDRHCYISFHDDQRPIDRDDILEAQKIFHVSPFMPIEGNYQFRFAYDDEKIGVWIDYYINGEKQLATSLTGKRAVLNAPKLLYCFFRYPLVTLKVIGLIHFEAVRLLFKGATYHPRPNPPSSGISR